MEGGDLEELKRRKLQELQQRLQEQAAVEQQKAAIEAQRREILKAVLTPEARQRLANVKIARPEYAAQVENLLIQLAQSGQLREKISDAQLRDVLSRLAARKKRDIKIRRI
ncbi:MAG: DNA-binding protein [Euryarchaeota archaeon]|nr:DNA-binding protein [Euryarchaeota archaeon]